MNNVRVSCNLQLQAMQAETERPGARAASPSAGRGDDARTVPAATPSSTDSGLTCPGSRGHHVCAIPGGTLAGTAPFALHHPALAGRGDADADARDRRHAWQQHTFADKLILSYSSNNHILIDVETTTTRLMHGHEPPSYQSSTSY